jgi:hypothetical protein
MRIDPELRSRWISWGNSNLLGRAAEISNAIDIALKKVLIEGTDHKDIMAAVYEAMPTLPADTYRGRAVSFQSRFEQSGQRNLIIWNFRLERLDRYGQLLDPIMMQMKGSNFSGAIANGDVIQFSGKPMAGQVVPTTSVMNLTAKCIVEAKGDEKHQIRFAESISKILQIVFAVMFLYLMLHYLIKYLRAAANHQPAYRFI